MRYAALSVAMAFALLFTSALAMSPAAAGETQPGAQQETATPVDMLTPESTPLGGLTPMVTPEAMEMLGADEAQVTVSDQEIVDGTVTIESVMATENGWIVIHRSEDGSVGADVGHAAVEEGENQNVEVELDLGQVTETLYAMLHVDAGEEGTYEFPGDDTPVPGDAADVNPSFMVTNLAAVQGEAPEDMETPEAMETPEDMETPVLGLGQEPAGEVAQPGGNLSEDVSIQLVQVADGLIDPVNVASPDDGTGRLFVLERTGTIRIIEDDELLDEPFLDISESMKTDFLEQGLLGMAFHPNYSENGYFYLNYTDWRTNGDTFVVRFSVSEDDPNVADPDSARVVLTFDQPYVNHNGGTLRFGPDGYLYIATGDGGLAGDPYENAQNTSNLLGKILRLDVDVEDEDGVPYRIPADNPFGGQVLYSNMAREQAGTDEYYPGARPEIWAYGLRNPWQFSFDPENGDLYIADVGQNAWEEINWVAAGDLGEGTDLNFGWDYLEASHPYPPEDDFVSIGILPVAEYRNPDEGCSVTGIGVYRGQESADLDGIYFASDFCSGRVWGLQQDDGGTWQFEELLDTELPVTGSGQDADGELYITACNCQFGRDYDPRENPGGTVWRIVSEDQVPEDAVTPGPAGEAVEETPEADEELEATPEATPGDEEELEATPEATLGLGAETPEATPEVEGTPEAGEGLAVTPMVTPEVEDELDVTPMVTPEDELDLDVTPEDDVELDITPEFTVEPPVLTPVPIPGLEETPGAEGVGEEVTIELVAEDIAFDMDTITVPAGAHVIVEFTNRDAVPHNLAVYQSEDAEESIFVGETITGPDESITYEFDAPEEPGTYFFRCDVHPVRMIGDLVVE